MTAFAFMNGVMVPEDEARLHYSDLSVVRGYGVFDFFRLEAGIPLHLPAHLDRLFRSAAEMRLVSPMSKAELSEAVYRLIEINGAKDGGIRISLTGGYSEDGYSIANSNLLITRQACSVPSKEAYDKGLNLWLYPFQRQFPTAKTIDYLMGIWLKPQICEQEADDALYYQNGQISECPRSNFFLVTAENRLVTPSQNILKGITRHLVLKLASSHFEVEERDVSTSEIETAREAFVTSSTKRILPVSRINERTFPDAHPITDRLSGLLRDAEEQFLRQHAEDRTQSVA